MELMNVKMKKRKGFTLVELVVVIAILGILAAIAVPKLSESRTKAANSAHNANVRTLESAATMFIAEEGAPSADITWDKEADANSKDKTDGLGWGSYLQGWPEVPKGAQRTLTDGKKEEVSDPYTVTIGANGDIKVAPTAIDLD